MLDILDADPQSLLEGMDNSAALAVKLSRYAVGNLGGPSSRTEGHCSMVSGHSSKRYRTEKEKRPGSCWSRSQDN